MVQRFAPFLYIKEPLSSFYARDTTTVLLASSRKSILMGSLPCHVLARQRVDGLLPNVPLRVMYSYNLGEIWCHLVIACLVRRFSGYKVIPYNTVCLKVGSHDMYLWYWRVSL
jgi:hypothetical protein